VRARGGRGLRLLALLLLLLLLSACAGETGKPEVGRPAPDFAFTTLDGRNVRLSELRGKVVFVNLWATWCPPCREEIPSMVALYSRFREQGLEILAVSEDREAEPVRRFMRQYGISFPVGLDAERKVYQLYRATGVPETHLIDKRGVLQASQLGPFDWTSPDVVETVRRLLAE
jgi:peroxiredoxin